ncbi:hypothetical protein HG535_0D00320 [Zygotorulaspora mrakii]|uniref:Globin domain-containing protein n=1 Tax=Zygotorulaspora mrakii TaxID=42260 RepID=A0A7H9B0X0_ZYGMR|nr:uncharacterized protein HG535_0D00320 [Zygotorulaspora mrakii]QLG72325.1 hypothetical protein HG535_0D00320 [Zygotorulaspora mrakii]
MNSTKNTLYNPLDRSQIEFIPSHFDVVTDSLIPIQESYSSDVSSISDRSHLSAKELNITARRGSFTISDIISNGVSRIQSHDSSLDDAYHLQRISTTESLGSSVLDRIRYKIVLKLNPKEKQLVRESWEMILNEDVTSKQLKPKPHTGKTFNVSNLLPMSSSTSEKNSESDSSVVSASHVPEPKGNTISRTFASSLFCSQFYANLLSMDPDLERMFPSIKHQATAFAGVLNAAISNLENLRAIEGYLISLGKRHARILDIEPPHFELMGIAFLKTLQDRFGVHCTIELEEVWSRLYSYLANSILQFGIDPVLQLNVDKDEIIFPVPNLVEGSGSTISRLNSNDSQDGAKSLRSIFLSRTTSAHQKSHDPIQNKPRHQAQLPDHASISGGARKRTPGSSMAPSRSGTASISSAIPVRRQPHAVSRTKVSDSKPGHKKATSKLSLSSNEDCCIM